MRVIAGAAGGIRLDVPKTDMRPTMDRVKAAIFSSLGDEIIGARVLDLFAGTGALGIEALSRGAASALFVEENSAAIAAIERNLPGRNWRAGSAGRMFSPSFVRRRPASLSKSFLPIRPTRKRNRAVSSPACCWKTRSWRKSWSLLGSLCWRSVQRSRCRGCHCGTSLGPERTAPPKCCFYNVPAVPPRCAHAE